MFSNHASSSSVSGFLPRAATLAELRRHFQSLLRGLATCATVCAPVVAGLQSIAAAPEVTAIVTAARAYDIGNSREAFAQIDQLIRESRAGDALRRELELKLAEALSSDAPLEAKRLICQRLWIIGTEASVPSIEPLLGKQDSAHLGCYALLNYETPAADAALRRGLASASGTHRLAIINTLGDRRDPASVEPLQRLAADADPDLARAALGALGRIATRQAVEALQATWGARNPAIADAAKFASIQAAQRLAAAGKESAARDLYRRLYLQTSPRLQRAALIGLTRLGGSEAIREIEAALRAPDPVLRATAIAQIPDLDGRKVSERFTRLLPEASPDVQALLIPALAARGDKVALPDVMILAESESPAVAGAALQALGKLGNKSAVPLLIAAASRGDNAANAAAALNSLRQLQDAGVNEAILLELESVPTQTKADLMEVLVTRQAREAVPVILRFTSSPYPKLYGAAFKALARLAEPAQLDALLTSLVNLSNRSAEEDAERAVVQVAHKIPNAARRSDAVLAAYEKAKTPPVKSSLLRVLGETSGPRALETVLAAAKDPDESVKDTALRTLANWHEPSALPEMLEKARAADKPTHQVLLLRGYLRLLAQPSQRAEAETLQAYEQALKLARRPDEKRIVLSGLASAGGPGALRLIAPLLDESSVQAEAALAAVNVVKSHPGMDPALARSTLQKVQAVATDPSVKKQAAALLTKFGR